jgi:hypothetical protein
MRRPKNTPITAEWLKSRTVTDERGCWIWQNHIDTYGYAQTHDSNLKTTKASRLMWALIHGPIPQGLFVCHHCDVKACINPEHLYLATPLKNTRDAIERGLLTFAHRPLQVGSSSPNHKLTERCVLFIRQEHPALGSATLANMFGVRPRTINSIIKRETWAHI